MTKEVRNGVTKYYLMKGELTASEEDDTSWVSGTCAEDHSGKFSSIFSVSWVSGTCAEDHSGKFSSIFSVGYLCRGPQW